MNKKISDLTAMVTYAEGDQFEVLDISEVADADKNKKLTKTVLFDSAPDFGNGLSLGDELLDTYDEGTWTPAITFGGSSVGITYNTQAGHYVKVGNSVILNAFINLTSKGSSTGVALITGLPFSQGAAAGMLSAPALWWRDITYLDSLTGLILNGGVVIFLYDQVSGVAATQLEDTNFQNDTEIVLSLSYLTT